MTQSTTSNGLFYDLFAPIPQTTADRKKDHLDHVAEYTASSSGAWDLFRVGNHIFSALEIYLNPSHHLSGLASKAREVFNSAGIALSIPQFFSDLNSLRKSITNLWTVQDLPYSDPLRARKIAQAAKQGFMDTNNLTWTGSQITLFLEGAKVITLKAAELSLVDTVNNVTGAIGDTDELLGEYYKLKQYHSPGAQPRNQAEASKLEEKKMLAWINIAKDAASLAAAAITAGIALYWLATGAVITFPVSLLALSSIWLTMKITSYFYNAVVVEAPLTPSLVT